MPEKSAPGKEKHYQCWGGPEVTEARTGKTTRKPSGALRRSLSCYRREKKAVGYGILLVIWCRAVRGIYFLCNDKPWFY